jgi:hypothetical protein
MRAWLSVAVVLVLAAALVGCGGSGSPSTAPVNAQGAIQGTLTGAPNPQSFSLYLDGQKLAPTPAANGSFSLPQVPAGRHTLALVSKSGMMGKYLQVDIKPGGHVNVGDVTPGPAGEIGGMVMQEAPDGTLTPLSGVEVLADSNVYVVPPGTGGGTGSGSGSGSTGSSAYPPPPTDPSLVEYKGISDDTGNYLIPGVAPGDYTVTVSVPGLVEGVQYVLVQAGQLSAANFQLQTAVAAGVGTVTGTVSGKQSDGTTAPLAGAMVTITVPTPWEPPLPLQPLPAPPGALARHPMRGQTSGGSSGPGIIMPPIYAWKVFQTLTDQNGNYSLNVPTGNLNLSVWAEGYAPFSQPVTVQPNQTTTVDCVLDVWTPPILPPSPGPVPGAAGKK